MLKSLRTTLALLAMTVALAAPLSAQQSDAPQAAKPQESPWAMRAPAAVPHGAPTLSAKEIAAMKAAEKGTAGAAGICAQGGRRDVVEGLRRDEAAVRAVDIEVHRQER